MSFNALPNEIVREILLHLAPKPVYDDEQCSGLQNTLTSVLRTCKLFHAIGRPILYHAIRILPVSACKLTRVLAQDASLSAAVRSIDLYDAQFLHFARQLLRDAVNAAADRLWLPPDTAQRLRLFQLIDDHPETMGVLAYLSLLPNVDEVWDMMIERKDVALVQDFFRQTGVFSGSSSIPPPRLRSLELLFDRPGALNDLGCWHESRRYEKTHISAISGLLQPTLKTLCVSSPLSWCSSRASFASLPDRLNLQSLELKHASVDAKGVEDILRRCPDLRRLSIQLGGGNHPDDAFLDLAALGHVLRQHGRQLVDLTLSVDYRVKCFREAMLPRGRMGSLRTLHKLKSLAVHQDLLLEYKKPEEEGCEEGTEEGRITLDRCLPDSLERLKLLCDWDFERKVGDPDVDEETLYGQISDLFRAQGRRESLRRVKMLRRRSGLGSTEPQRYWSSRDPMAQGVMNIESSGQWTTFRRRVDTE